eukprot:GHRR01033678.1.p1 GENE.GHRR01033678.1~~GHRR01033678.1.p1  ORF type:complete len:132 (+),score=19.56 GHRR01033678.1:107-502(+)
MQLLSVPMAIICYQHLFACYQHVWALHHFMAADCPLMFSCTVFCEYARACCICSVAQPLTDEYPPCCQGTARPAQIMAKPDGERSTTASKVQRPTGLHNPRSVRCTSRQPPRCWTTTAQFTSSVVLFMVGC